MLNRFVAKRNLETLQKGRKLDPCGLWRSLQVVDESTRIVIKVARGDYWCTGWCTADRAEEFAVRSSTGETYALLPVTEEEEAAARQLLTPQEGRNDKGRIIRKAVKCRINLRCGEGKDPRNVDRSFAGGISGPRKSHYYVQERR